jgi:hypothetical protein
VIGSKPVKTDRALRMCDALIFTKQSCRSRHCLESNSLMPVAQFNPFEKLDKSIMYTGGEDDAYEVWHRLSDDANRYLDGVEDGLIGRAKSGTS